MTDQALQEAINRAREFMNLAGQPGGLLNKSRAQTAIALEELERVQVTRAQSLAPSPPAEA